MKQQSGRYFAILAVALVMVACGSNDASIGKAVNEKLSADETVKPAQISVAVQKKIVTLSGTVDSTAIKERAVAVTRATDGVADVVDQINVKEQNSGLVHGPDVGHEMMRKHMTEDKDHPVEADRK